jgi:hypothetical protein
MTNTNEVVTSTGLTTEAARKLQEQYGRNELIPPPKKENLLGKICHILVGAYVPSASWPPLLFIFCWESRGMAVSCWSSSWA